MRLLGYEDRGAARADAGQPRQDGRDLHRPAPATGSGSPRVAYAEEDAFRQTLQAGTAIFDLAATEVKQSGSTQLSGDQAFALHDTYGFPIDLTLEMASEQGLSVDEEGFRRLMAEQRERAKADARAKKGQHGDAARLPRGRRLARPPGASSPATTRSSPRARSRGIVASGGVVESAREGDEIELVLDRTPFYAEGGGQLADQGVIELENGARLEVRDVQSPITGLIVHQAKVLAGEVTPGVGAQALVDIERRRSISRSHTGDPHGAQGVPRGARRHRHPGRLRELARAGSASTSPRPARCRRSVMEDVEARVNDLVLADLAVHAELHDPGRGREVGRDGAVRREVRRRGARRLGRRLGARALRRHPRRPLRRSSA